MKFYFPGGATELKFSDLAPRPEINFIIPKQKRKMGVVNISIPFFVFVLE